MIVAVGMLHQETNTFNRCVTRIDDLDVCVGNDVLDCWRGKGMGLAGGIEVLESKGMQLRGLLAATGASGGCLGSDDCEQIIHRMVDGALKARPDAIYLDLHGALVGQSVPDVTGTMLRRLVEELGRDIPIAASLDCHANLTKDIVSNLDVMVGFKTWPHEDYWETGSHAAEIFSRSLKGEIQPALRVVTMPMIQAPENSDFSRGPMASLVSQLADRQDRQEILDGTLFPTQPWMDIPGLCSSVSVMTDGDGPAAEKIACQVAQAWWAKRKEFVPTLFKPLDAVKRALEESVPTVMISESADSINSGSSGDNPELLRALVKNGGEAKALVFLCDPALLDQILGYNSGSDVQVVFGKDCDGRFATPFPAMAVVEGYVPGKFRSEGKYFTGLEQDMGGAAILRIRNIHVLVGRRPVMCSEPNLYRCANLEPADYKIVGIKSPGSFRPNFASISTTVLHLDMAGASSPHLVSMPWRSVGRPLFPLDEDTPYTPICISGKSR